MTTVRCALTDVGYRIPSDYKKPFAVSVYPILKGILELGYEIVLDNQYFPYKDGKRKFGRCLIKKKKENR